MNVKKFSDAMSELDTKYVDEALNYKKKDKKPIWIKWGAMAACLCVLVVGAVYLFAQFDNEHGSDIEPGIEITLEEAVNNETFGKLFPTWIFEDYTLEGSVGVFGDTVLRASFYSESHVDELQIQITDREWFYSQHPDLELNTVIYRETTEGTRNQIYIDGGDYVVRYSCIVSMKNNSDFLRMVNSATYFQEKGESLVWFGDKLIKTGDLSETTLQWLDWYNGLSEEEQLAISAIPADLLEASGISNAEDTEATSE